MKFQKLTICNLASIEHAEIDFDNNPLSDSEVFLISGKTGAGKSTILDAICLALYGNTPRLENTNMKGGTEDGKDTVKIDDPRQMMRKNTTEAFALLTFIGNNGVHYEAKWYVKRAHNKVTGALQSKVWTLTNLDTNDVLSKDKEIAKEISEVAAGLDFSQFCRTTMLAQGDFTKFLNSNDDDRAAILEKITGLGIYTKIGKKINDMAKAKRLEFEEIKRQVEGTTVMTDEEIAEKRAETERNQAEQNKARAEMQTAQDKMSWIATSQKLDRDRDDAKSALDNILSITESQEFKDMERLCREWTETIEARKWLDDWNSANNTIAAQIEALKAAKQTFSTLLGGELWLRNDAEETEKKIVALTETVEAEKDKAAIYDNAQTINSLIKSIEDGKANISDNTRKMNDVEKEISEKLVPGRDKASESYKNAESLFKAKESELAEKQQAFESAKLPDLRTEKEKHTSALTNIATAKDKIKNLEQARRENEAKRKAMADREQKISELKAQAEDLALSVKTAEECEKAARETKDRQSATVNDWAKEMRAKLKVGDTCPVCGQAITVEFEKEDVLSKVLAEAEKAWKEADKKLNDLKDKANSTNAAIEAQTSSLENDRREIENNTTLARFEKDAQTACQKCSIDTIDDSTGQKLDQLEIQTREALETVTAKISYAEKLDKAVNDTRRELENLRNKKDEAYRSVESANISIKESEGKKNQYASLIESKGKDVAAAENVVAGHLAGSAWADDWKSDTDSFRNELNSAAQKYAENRKSLEAMQNSLDEKKRNINGVESAMKEISSIPGFGDIEPREAAEVKDMLNKAYSLGNAAKTAIEKQNEATALSKDMESRLGSYYEQNSGMNAEKLAQLGKYSQSDISAKNSEIRSKNEQKISKATLLEQSEKAIAEHNSKKPKFDENDNAESLANTIREKEELYKQLSEMTGAINQQLAQNEENKAKLGKLIEECDAKKKVHEKWSSLNTLFGDAEGKTFRKIAQSYVLSNLMHAANSYMRTLTDRYTLSVNPGTFVIMLEDAYQGYEKRVASTMSGGEGFLVSLALALALSDIGNRLSVDTLFIDEGFGTLSGEPLHNAINTLRTLHSKAGRHVGIISHVEELKERIPVQIQVIQEGNNSSSEVRVVS